jgi:hypothetical protein
VPAEADDPLARQLRALRREYVADSSKRVDELRSLLDRLSRGERSTLGELRQAFHRLAGSGGSYGFPLVSTRGRDGEHLAQHLLDGDAAVSAADLQAVAACIDGVAGAFAEALHALATERAG